MNNYCISRFNTVRTLTSEVQVGNVKMGANNPIVVQSMTNTKTQDVDGSVKQCIQLAEAGCQIAGGEAFPYGNRCGHCLGGFGKNGDSGGKADFRRTGAVAESGGTVVQPGGWAAEGSQHRGGSGAQGVFRYPG